MVIFGGGYDSEEDNYPEPWDDNNNNGVFDSADETYDEMSGNGVYDYFNPDMNETGRGIFVVDLHTGGIIYKATYADHPDMTWCFPADPTVIDLTTSLLVYITDVYGQVWKMTYNYYRSPSQWEVKRIFTANPGSDLAKAADVVGASPVTPMLDDMDRGRKTFYSPDVTYFGTDWTDLPVLYFGTGDRAHPRYIPNYENRFYSITDSNALTDETHLLNLTCNELDSFADANQDGTPADSSDNDVMDGLFDILYGYQTYTGGDTCRGWYRILGEQGNCTQDSVDHSAEMVLSRPTLFYGGVYFTTYQPVFNDPCNPGGNAFLYAMDYNSGGAFLDLNSQNNTKNTLEDSYRKVENATIPSGIRVIIRGGKAAGFVSIGGALEGAGEPGQSPNDESASSTIPSPPGGVIKILWETY